MSAPKCSVCGVEGARLYVSRGPDLDPAFEPTEHLRCSGHVPSRPDLLWWAPYVPDLVGPCPLDFGGIELAVRTWVALPEAAYTPVWTCAFGWIDIENAPGAT